MLAFVVIFTSSVLVLVAGRMIYVHFQQQAQLEEMFQEIKISNLQFEEQLGSLEKLILCDEKTQSHEKEEGITCSAVAVYDEDENASREAEQKLDPIVYFSD